MKRTYSFDLAYFTFLEELFFQMTKANHQGVGFYSSNKYNETEDELSFLLLCYNIPRLKSKLYDINNIFLILIENIIIVKKNFKSL